MSERFRCGDVVRHRPSGEEWIVAFCERGMLAPSGWPCCVVPASDCEMITAASEEEHVKHVREWLASPASEDDLRRSVVERMYGRGMEPEVKP